MGTPQDRPLEAHLERLLAAHDRLIRAMESGVRISRAPSRLMSLNAKIHQTYRRLASGE